MKTFKAWVCRRCGAIVKKNRYGWFDCPRCDCQHADYVDVE